MKKLTSVFFVLTFTVFLPNCSIIRCIIGVKGSNNVLDIKIKGHEIINCPDGEPVTIIDIDKAFPVYGIRLSANLKALFSELNLVEKKLLETKLPEGLNSSDISADIVKFRQDLNQQNIDLENRLKAAIFGLQTTPCDSLARKKFWTTLDEINLKSNELKKIKNEIRDLNFQSSKIGSEILTILRNRPIETTIITSESGPITTDYQRELNAKIDTLRSDIYNLKAGLTRYVIGELFFESGKADLTTEAKRYLQNIGAIFKQVEDKEILIFGHADNVPIKLSYQYVYKNNYELSRARAYTVASFLSEEVNLSPNKINIAGLSEDHPIAPNDLENSRHRNRRVEILLVTEGDLLSIPHEKYLCYKKR